MSVRCCLTAGESVDAGYDDVVRVADFKGTRGATTTKSVLRWAVEAEANTVKSVLAETFGVGTIVLADLDAELVVTNEPEGHDQTADQSKYDDITYSVHQLIWYSVVLKAVE